MSDVMSKKDWETHYLAYRDLGQQDLKELIEGYEKEIKNLGDDPIIKHVVDYYQEMIKIMNMVIDEKETAASFPDIIKNESNKLNRFKRPQKHRGI